MSDVNQNQAAVEVQIEPLDKAAILLLSMGADAAAKVLKRLSRDEVQTLTACMARLSGVSAFEAKWTLQQFFELYKSQSGISGASRDYLERTLDLALGNKLSRGMLDSIYGDVMSQDLQCLQWVPPEVLARFFRHEHPQMQAVLLAFLPPDTASAVLDVLPAEQHDELLLRVASLKDVSELVLEELRTTLDRCLAYVAEQAGARVDGIRQVADILNRYQGDRAQMLDLLRLHDQALAVEVEKNMFDFETIKRQSDETMQVLIQELPTEVLAVALKGADLALRKAILNAMPKRMAQGLEAEIQNQGAVSVRKVEEARTEIMQRVRELVEQGEIEYRLFDEPVMS